MLTLDVVLIDFKRAVQFLGLLLVKLDGCCAGCHGAGVG
jgi:hypothetical protein